MGNQPTTALQPESAMREPAPVALPSEERRPPPLHPESPDGHPSDPDQSVTSSSRVICLAVSPTLTHAAAGEVAAVRLWDLATGAHVRSWRVSPGAGPVRDITFTADAAFVLAAIDNTVARIPMSEDEGEAVVVVQQRNPITSFALSQGMQHRSRKLVTTSYDNTVSIYDAPADCFAGPEPPPLVAKAQTQLRAAGFVVCFSPDSRYLAVGMSTGEIRAYAALTFKPIAPFTTHHEAVLALDIGWAGAERHLLLASGGGDHCVRVHSLMTSELMFELDGHVEPVTSVAFSSEGVYLASASRDGTVALWSTISGCQLWLYVGHTGVVNALTFVPSIEERLLTAGDDGSIREWSLKTGKQKAVW